MLKEFLILFLLGAFVGPISSFFGIGGGVLIIPALFFLYPGIDPVLVIGTSLGFIFLNSIYTAIIFFRLKYDIKVKFFIKLILGCILGPFVGVRLLMVVGPATIKIIFSIMLILTSLISIVKKTEIKTADSKKARHFEDTSSYKIIFVGFLGGLIACITGLGGGVIMVPLLLNVIYVPANKVSFYSTLTMIFSTLASLLQLFFVADAKSFEHQLSIMNATQVGPIDFSVLILIFLGSTLTSKYGIHLSHKLSPEKLSKVFHLLLIMMGAKIFISNLT